MADYIPFEIQEEIIKKLPVKSLIRFQSVSKSWMSLIRNSKFIANYHVHQTHHLLVTYEDVKENLKRKYVSIVDDDDSFPQHKVSLNVPVSVLNLNKPTSISSSQGVLCLYSFNENPRAPKMVVLWNPIINKSVDIDVPNVLDNPYQTVIGFGVCPFTNDIKLVKVNFIESIYHIETISCIPWQVEVFTLSSRTWRSLSCTNNLPRKSILFEPEQVNVDGFIYWLGFDRNRNYVDGVENWYVRIISFDIKSENFEEKCLPNDLNNYVSISKLRESLVLLEYNDACDLPVYVWTMKDGFFNKLFSIDIIDVSIFGVLEFRKSGEPILELEDEDLLDGRRVVAYEPHSKDIIEMGIYGRIWSNVACSYRETLFLLDH